MKGCVIKKKLNESGFGIGGKKDMMTNGKGFFCLFGIVKTKIGCRQKFERKFGKNNSKRKNKAKKVLKKKKY